MTGRKDIEDFIDSIEDEERRVRLRRMQWRIDMELGRIRNPIARMNRMVVLFWEGVDVFQRVLSNPAGMLSDREKCPVAKFAHKNDDIDEDAHPDKPHKEE
jgi:hypothetical protein